MIAAVFIFSFILSALWAVVVRKLKQEQYVHCPKLLTGGPGAAPGGVASKNGWVYMHVQVKSSQELLPGIHETFWNPPQGEAKRDNNPRDRSCAQCVVCGQELFQRLMSRGLHILSIYVSDRGRLHILFHPLGPLGCCRPQAQAGTICSLS